jgi:ketosteroid isomerase-like protein
MRGKDRALDNAAKGVQEAALEGAFCTHPWLSAKNLQLTNGGATPRTNNMAMKLFQILVITAALVVSASAIAEPADKEGEVRDAVRTFGLAYVAADTLTLKSLLANDYVHVNGGTGTVLNRDDWLAWVKSRRAAMEKGTLKVEDYRIEDVEISLIGNVAIVVGRVISSTREDGVLRSSELRFTNTWVYREGSWRRALFHDSPMPISAPDKP